MSDEEHVKRGFWRKVRKTAGKVPFVPDAVAMYYCMIDVRTPAWVKVAAASALAYFILPADAIPDFLAPVGYTDDAAIIAGTLRTISNHVTQDHYDRARDAVA